MVNRYYDPATGQFLSVDPLVDETGQAYAYTGDDPVDGADPMGLKPIVDPAAPLGMLPTDFLPPGNENWMVYEPSAATYRQAAEVESQAECEALLEQEEFQRQLILNELQSGQAPPLQVPQPEEDGPSAAQLYVASQLDAFWTKHADAAYSQWSETEGLPDRGFSETGPLEIINEIGLHLLPELLF